MLLKNALFKVENRNTQALEQDATSLVSLTHITFARPVILGTQWICSGQGHCGLEAVGIGSPCIRPLLLLRWPRTAEKCCRVCAVQGSQTAYHNLTCVLVRCVDSWPHLSDRLKSTLPWGSQRSHMQPKLEQHQTQESLSLIQLQTRLYIYTKCSFHGWRSEIQTHTYQFFLQN